MFGENVAGYDVPVLNEREVRAGAGILFFITLTVFLGAWHADQMLPAQMMIVAFFIDFVIRVWNPRYSPSLILGRLAVGNQVPEYTAAAPKRFAWIIGLMLASFMLVTLIFMRHMSMVNFAVCGVCIVLLFMESAFGICLGCLFYSLVYREQPTLCPGEVCTPNARLEVQKASASQFVVTVPFWKSGWLTTFSTNGIFVFTPRMRNSRKARSMRLQASGNVRPQLVTFTSSES